MNTLEKIRMLKKRSEQQRGGTTQGLFLKFKKNHNIIRLVGEPLETKSHYLGVNKKFKNDKRAVLKDGTEGISTVVNCANWDINKEEETGEKKCIICKLNEMAHENLNQMTSDGADDTDIQFMKDLRSKTRARSILKWNVIDRDNPNVTRQNDSGDEDEVFGYKIANIGPEAWEDIAGIFEQVGFDISDFEDGIDIDIKKVEKDRVYYSVKAVMEDGAVVKTPLTDEEREVDLNDLKVICGKQVDQSNLLEAIQDDYRELLEVWESDQDSSKENEDEDSSEDDEDDSSDDEDDDSSEDDSSDDEDDDSSEDDDDEDDDEDVGSTIMSDDDDEDEDDDSSDEDEDSSDEDEDSSDEDEDEDEDEDSSDEDEDEDEDSSDEDDDSSDEDENSSDSQLAEPTSWPCFGDIEIGNEECDKCENRELCAEKAGIDLNPKPKKAKKAKKSKKSKKVDK